MEKSNNVRNADQKKLSKERSHVLKSGLYRKLMTFSFTLLTATAIVILLIGIQMESDPGKINAMWLSGMAVLILGGIATHLFLKNIVRPLKGINDMIREMSQGYFGTRLEIKANDEIGEIGLNLNHLADYFQNDVIEVISRIAAGDLSIDLESRNNRDEIAISIQQTINAIDDLNSKVTQIAQAVIEGRLSIRGDSKAVKGVYKMIIDGVNIAMDAVIFPVKTASDYIYQIGQGEIPPPITDSYRGEFDILKNNINASIEGLCALKESNRVLALMSINDFTQTVQGNYIGIYDEIAKFINAVNIKLVRVVEISSNIAEGDMCDLEALRKVPRQSENDRIIPSLIGMIENIIQLVEETETMTEIAVAGDLGNRGDISKFNGEFARVIGGFNQILDAVIAPVMEASDTLKKLSQGNLDSVMLGDYQGDHARIKEDLNETIAFLKRYVSEITTTLEEMGRGNLNQEITTDYLGDFLAIKTALNSITKSLSETMSDIHDAAGQVEVGAQQISDGAQALAQGTTEQASSIQELTASIEEVAGETKKNAVRANDANELALVVRQSAKTGNEQMKSMLTAMIEINESSNDISKIIKVIDDIAFQTNILALNAAVEAARAGQHGKGFAVVAEEVRTLAARSAEAAKETTGLIEGSIEKVKAGSKIADDTADSLKDIENRIEKVTNLVGNIAQASNEQASEIAQITQGIEQVSMVVQTNSATAEESAAASEELSGQAELLKKMVDAFQLKI